MVFPNFFQHIHVRPAILAGRTAVCLLMLLAFAGCRSEGKFDSPYPKGPDVLARGTVENIAELLSGRTRDHEFLWRRGRVILRQEGVKGKLWFEATVLYRDPDAVRLRGSRVPLGTIFEVGINGEDAWVYLNRDKELYEGTLDTLKEQGGVVGNLAPSDLMAAVLVSQDLLRRLREPGSWTTYETEREIFLSQKIEDGRRMVWRIGRGDGLVREAVIWSRDGRTADARVTYRSYKLYDDEPLPGEFKVDVLDGAATVLFRFDKYKLGQELDPRVFQAPAAKLTFPLEELVNRDAVIPPEEQ